MVSVHNSRYRSRLAHCTPHFLATHIAIPGPLRPGITTGRKARFTLPGYPRHIFQRGPDRHLVGRSRQGRTDQYGAVSADLHAPHRTQGGQDREGPDTFFRKSIESDPVDFRKSSILFKIGNCCLQLLLSILRHLVQRFIICNPQNANRVHEINDGVSCHFTCHYRTWQ